MLCLNLPRGNEYVYPGLMLNILGAFIRRDYLDQNRYSPIWIGQVTAAAFQVFSTYFTAQLFNGNPALTNYGGNYYPYAMVGGLLLQVLLGLMRALPQAIERAQSQGTLEPMLTSPTPLGSILLGASSFQSVTTLASALLCALLAGIPMPLVGAHCHWGVVLLVLVLHLLLAWGIGVITASVTLAAKVTPPFPTLVLSLCSLLAGYFYPVALLPQPLRSLSELLPFTWGMEALRLALVGQVALRELGAFALAAGLVLLVGTWIFRYALGVAQRDGTLTFG